jgi:hypothetical protein
VPNLLPKGIWGEVDGQVLAADEVWATLPGSTVPRSASQVWCSGDNGVPVLVWAAAALAPTGVAAAYNAATQQVAVTWTLPAETTADTWEIRRPDGTVAGQVAGTVTQFTDIDPVAVTGTYKVVGLLGGKTGAQAASNSVALGNAVGSFTQTWVGSPSFGPKLSWTHPSYGRPEQYRIYQAILTTTTGPYTLLATIAGNSLDYQITGFPPQTAGQGRFYMIVPVLSNTEGASDTEFVTRGSATPGSFDMNYHDNCLDGDFNRMTWTTPAYGTPDSYQVYLDGNYLGPLPGTATYWDTQPHWGESHRYLLRAIYGNSGYNTNEINHYVTPVAPQFVYVYLGGNGTFQVQWGAPVVGAFLGYRVEVWQNIAGVDSKVRTTDVSNNVDRILNYTGLNNTNHYVRVYAHSGVIGVNPPRLSQFISSYTFNPWSAAGGAPIGYFTMPCIPSVGGHVPGG